MNFTPGVILFEGDYDSQLLLLHAGFDHGAYSPT